MKADKGQYFKKQITLETTHPKLEKFSDEVISGKLAFLTKKGFPPQI